MFCYTGTEKNITSSREYRECQCSDTPNILFFSFLREYKKPDEHQLNTVEEL